MDTSRRDGSHDKREPPHDADAATARRRVVLHPRTAAARRQDRARSFGGHVRGYTVDTDAVLELVHRQRRASLRYLALILVPLVCFAFGLNFVSELGRVRPFGLLPLPWLILGPGALFSIVGLAFFHERTALRIEQEWSDEQHTGRSDRSTA